MRLSIRVISFHRTGFECSSPKFISTEKIYFYNSTDLVVLIILHATSNPFTIKGLCAGVGYEILSVHMEKQVWSASKPPVLVSLLSVCIDVIAIAYLAVGMFFVLTLYHVIGEYQSPWVTFGILFIVFVLYGLLSITPLRGTIGQYLTGIRYMRADGSSRNVMAVFSEALLAVVSLVFSGAADVPVGKGLSRHEQYRPVRKIGISIFFILAIGGALWILMVMRIDDIHSNAASLEYVRTDHL